MDEKRLAATLTGLLTAKLAGELASDFVKIRGDLASGTLERASPGKFVETFVQCHQQMATGNNDASPSIETYLTKYAENQMALDEGLRVVAPARRKDDVCASEQAEHCPQESSRSQHL